MPIFQDDLGHDMSTPPTKTDLPYRNPTTAKQTRRKASEEIIQTELCEGVVPENLHHYGKDLLDSDLREEQERHKGISDRVKLIESLKRGESPTWVPNRYLKSILHDYEGRPLPHISVAQENTVPSLLPAADIKKIPQSVTTAENETQTLQSGLAIERPGSALHSGDFTQDQSSVGNASSIHHNHEPFGTTESWLATSPPRHFTPFQRHIDFSLSAQTDQDSRFRSRAPSLSSSLSSSFVFKAPTSPLVQSESNDDLDFSSSLKLVEIYTKTPQIPRRSNYQPVHTHQSASASSPFDRSVPHLRRDQPHPYQAHQPRRSLTSIQGIPQSQPSPQTPALFRSRRPSFTLDSSPLQHASMVGSYEESILHGRMSTTPSRPLDFVAQIGVLGLGKCKSSLRCPAHVTLPFPAVFYSYGSTTHDRSGKLEDGPSPYVGLIDLENGLPNQESSNHELKRRRAHVNLENSSIDIFEAQAPEQNLECERRRTQKQKRRSSSPRKPPGGSYRIPEKGQLQIIIKNPNKTAVKLFLVPYDLAGMEPGTKTFIRQISYSAGPIIDSIVPSPQLKALDPTKEKVNQTLRYLIHLHICSPSRGRFYLYKSIRVVFANRVPDGKENLKNEVKWPEPRWAIYKPGRESAHGLSHTSGPGAALTADKAFRRRSSGFVLTPHRNFDIMDGIAQALHANVPGEMPYPSMNELYSTPVEPIPFSLFPPRAYLKEESEITEDNTSQLLSPTSSKSSRPPTSQGSGMSTSWNSDSTGISGYDKLNKGDIGYGGRAFTGTYNGQQAASEGLLALKLKEISVGRQGEESPTGSMKY